MEFSIKGIILIICIMVVTVYLIVAAMEDKKSMEVTRIKHLIGFIPAVVVFLMSIRERSVSDIAMIAAFIRLFFACGRIGIYGMADGFVFGNLILLFGGMCGTTGVGLVILMMVLASFSGLVEMLGRGLLTYNCLKQNRAFAFVPHILNGYVAVMVAMFLWIQNVSEYKVVS